MKFRTSLALWLVPLALLGSSVAKAQSTADVFWGIGRAKDGDTLVVGSREVRLFGIDAPEFDQTCQRAGKAWPCGSEAATKLSELATAREIRCVATGADQFGRTLAKCSAGAVDINRAMVASGYAVAFRRYSADYASAEESARVNSRGLWSGKFQMPQDYRSGAAAPSSPAPDAPRSTKASRSWRSGVSSSDWAGRARANCNIKGNRNQRGQWIYHVPGMPYYDRTRPEEIFCSEAEAQAAGYRRAIVQR